MHASCRRQIIFIKRYLVGQTFLSFQWDILLLESGFYAILWSKWTWSDAEPASRSVQWAVRFLLFKLMLMSGVVKITANCPTWLGLTALDYHFATQCLPTPFAWMFHQLPPLMLQAGVAATFVVEIPAAFIVLVPNKAVRQWAAWIQIFFQVGIILTGNYTFFNFLTVILCFSLLDGDSFWWSSASANGEGPSKRVKPVFTDVLLKRIDAKTSTISSLVMWAGIAYVRANTSG